LLGLWDSDIAIVFDRSLFVRVVKTSIGLLLVLQKIQEDPNNLLIMLVPQEVTQFLLQLTCMMSYEW